MWSNFRGEIQTGTLTMAKKIPITDAKRVGNRRAKYLQVLCFRYVQKQYPAVLQRFRVQAASKYPMVRGA